MAKSKSSQSGGKVPDPSEGAKGGGKPLNLKVASKAGTGYGKRGR